MSRCRRLICPALLAAAALCAEELPRGKITDPVPCRGSQHQTYALYLPSAYAPDRPWPILYCLDPGARGRLAVEHFAEAAEREGFLVAGSNNSRNGPLEPAREAISAMVTDTHARFTIDDQRFYAAGFSGGARLALSWAQNGRIAGVVACGAGFGQTGIPRQVPFRIFMTAGVDDFNYHEMHSMSLDLVKRGSPHRFVEFDGGHDWLPSALAAEALAFFTGRVPAQAAKESKDEQKQHARFLNYSQRLWDPDGPDRSLIEMLHSDAAKAADGPDRRVARRVVSGAFVGAMETSRDLMDRKDYAGAARNWEFAVLLRPEAAGAWYALAVAQAAAGNKRRALEALQQAVGKGFHDLERIEQEPLLAPLRGDRRYRSILATLQP